MSKQVLTINLENNNALIARKTLGYMCIDQDRGTIDYVNPAGEAEHIVMFESSDPADYMLKSVYDVNNDNMVDDTYRFGGQLPSFYATAAQVAVKGDMFKVIYDTNNSGVVDDSERLGGEPSTYYAPITYVNTKGDMFKAIYDADNDGVIDLATNATLAVTASNALLLDSHDKDYYLDYNNFINVPATSNWGNNSFTPLNEGDMIVYSSGFWRNTSIIDAGSFI